jgi:hypothetical protein
VSDCQYFSAHVQRRAFINEICPLIALLLALVQGHDVPLTTKETWATGFATPLAIDRRQATA